MRASDKLRQNIRDIREDKHFTQADMAEKLGLSITGYAKIERGQSQINIERLQQISKVLEVSIAELIPFGDDGVVVFNNSNDNLLVIVDYTKPSTEERLFVIDLRKKQLLISSLVTHGRGTGGLYATNFSNKNNSYSTSSGFYLTGNIYNGKHGESLVLYGLEKDKNDNAQKRTIVMHQAYYANKSFAKKYGRLGRSKGCLALPTDLNSKIINLISDGVVLYVHTNFDENKEYDFSKLLSKSF